MLVAAGSVAPLWPKEMTGTLPGVRQSRSWRRGSVRTRGQRNKYSGLTFPCHLLQVPTTGQSRPRQPPGAQSRVQSQGDKLKGDNAAPEDTASERALGCHPQEPSSQMLQSCHFPLLSISLLLSLPVCQLCGEQLAFLKKLGFESRNYTLHMQC